MRGKRMVAPGRLVFSNRERVIALEAYDKGLLGTTLRYSDEVRKAEDYFGDLPVRIPTKSPGHSEMMSPDIPTSTLAYRLAMRMREQSPYGVAGLLLEESEPDHGQPHKQRTVASRIATRAARVIPTTLIRRE